MHMRIELVVLFFKVRKSGLLAYICTIPRWETGFIGWVVYGSGAWKGHGWTASRRLLLQLLS